MTFETLTTHTHRDIADRLSLKPVMRACIGVCVCVCVRERENAMEPVPRFQQTEIEEGFTEVIATRNVASRCLVHNTQPTSPARGSFIFTRALEWQAS